jgi:hypothetical protein
MDQVTQLTAAVTDLEREVARLRAAFRRRTTAMVAVAVAGTLMVGVLGWSAVDARQHEAADARRWCLVIDLSHLDPTVQRDRDVAALAQDLHCPAGAA